MAYDFLLLCLPFQNIHWSKERKGLWDFYFFSIVCCYIPNKMAKEVSFLHNNSMSSNDQSISHIKMQVCVCVCVCARACARACTKSLSHVPLFATLWTVAHQSPLSMGFSRQEYWSGLPWTPSGDLSYSGTNLHFFCLLHWQMGSLPLTPAEMAPKRRTSA